MTHVTHFGCESLSWTSGSSGGTISELISCVMTVRAVHISSTLVLLRSCGTRIYLHTHTHL